MSARTTYRNVPTEEFLSGSDWVHEDLYLWRGI